MLRDPVSNVRGGALAILAGPRLTLDALRYAEGSDLKISFQNLPLGSSAAVKITDVAADDATAALADIPEATAC